MGQVLDGDDDADDDDDYDGTHVETFLCETVLLALLILLMSPLWVHGNRCRRYLTLDGIDSAAILL